MAWFPCCQLDGVRAMHVEVRMQGESAPVEYAVRRSLGQFAPYLAMLQPMTQEEKFKRSFTEQRLLARLSIFFRAAGCLPCRDRNLRHIVLLGQPTHP